MLSEEVLGLWTLVFDSDASVVKTGGGKYESHKTKDQKAKTTPHPSLMEVLSYVLSNLSVGVSAGNNALSAG